MSKASLEGIKPLGKRFQFSAYFDDKVNDFLTRDGFIWLTMDRYYRKEWNCAGTLFRIKIFPDSIVVECNTKDSRIIGVDDDKTLNTIKLKDYNTFAEAYNQLHETK